MAPFTRSRTKLWMSIGLSALIVLFLLADAAVSIFAPQLLADVQAKVGFPPDLANTRRHHAAVRVPFCYPKDRHHRSHSRYSICGRRNLHALVGEIGSPPQFISLALAAVAWLSLWLRDANVRGAIGFRGSH
jgi:hypothetical protein